MPEQTDAERRGALVDDFRHGGRRPEHAAERSRGGGRADDVEHLEVQDLSDDEVRALGMSPRPGHVDGEG